MPDLRDMKEFYRMTVCKSLKCPQDPERCERGTLKNRVHEMLKMLLVQVQRIKVLSKNRYCSWMW